MRTVSRRALLGAALALPTLSRHPGLDPGSSLSLPAQPTKFPVQARDEERWRKALGRFQAAEAALTGLEQDEDRFDRAVGAFYAALRRLIRTPVPDLQALALKIELGIDHDIATLSGAESCLAVLRRDARRLAEKRS